MFWKSTVNVLKKILQIGAQTAPAIITAYDAPLGALLTPLFNSILTAQAQAPKADPGAKKDLALAALQAAMPVIEQSFVQNNKNIHDAALFAQGIEKLHDGLVDVLNSTGAPAQ